GSATNANQAEWNWESSSNIVGYVLSGQQNL
ncbi:unnamed protein product, partial [marine sediment metagenome]